MNMEQGLVAVDYDERKLQRRNHQIAVLLDLSDFLASSMDTQVLLDGALSRTLNHFDFQAGRIYLMDADGEQLCLAAYQGLEPEGLEVVRIRQGFSGMAARTRSFLARRVTDLDDPRRVEILLGKGLETIVCVPLVTLDRVVGVMNLASDRVIDLDQGTVDLLLIVGNQIAFAVNGARFHEEVQSKVRDLQEKKETIKFFAFSASHDLKCPAVGLNGLAERFHRHYRDQLDDRGRALCDQILATSRHLLALSERMNAYVTAREAPLQLETVSVRDLAETVRCEFDAVLRQRGIAWHGPDGPAEVRADRLSILRFLQNCVDNALKYAGAGLSEIRIEHRETEDHHVLSVRDDGVGMPPEDADRLFDLFHRHATSRGTEGAGLGLAIVKKIAERHGGEAWVDTSVGGGTTFHLSLRKQLPT